MYGVRSKFGRENASNKIAIQKSEVKKNSDRPVRNTDFFLRSTADARRASTTTPLSLIRETIDEI